MLHREAITIVVHFISFMINHHSDTKRMSCDLLSKAMSTLGEGVKDELVSTSIPSKIIDQHCYFSPIWICSFVIMFLVLGHGVDI